MNDPGLDKAATQAAEDVEANNTQYDQDKEQAEEEEQEFLKPGRWWFASTACPLIAGTFGPMANAFSICALPEKWRVYIPSGSDEGHGFTVEDPKWLITINSISLVFALTANMFLLLNMARRVPFAVAQPITLVGFYTASLLLMALVGVASTSVFRLEPRQEHALSQAYYYAMIASGLYFIIATLMLFTIYGAYKGRYPKEFTLSPSQRTLMLQTIGFMFYLLLGALIFAEVEGWNFLDGVFYADFTLLTVGIGGEFVPTTHTARSLLFPYAIGGLVIVGLVIGSIRSLILEHGKQKMAARFTEIKRERVLASYNDKTRTIRLGWFSKMEYFQKGLSEAQKREQEFRVMRKIQEISERNRRYTSLAISSTAAMLLWFLGALVFMFAEQPQGWTYFSGLYFAYTSLLTIGYGDLVPQSNAGKAFFVFWSLLAVPTLTILISNMGDTIIKEFKDFTIWVGSLTLLPDEEGLMSTLKIGTKRMRKVYKEESQEADPGASLRHMMDRLRDHMEEEELGLAEEAGEHGDKVMRDIHFYHFILSKEIRQLMIDVDASPPRQYSYSEWAYYLRLLGQDENDSSYHRRARVHHKHGNRSTPDLGTADDGDEQTWSWLGIRSPLMGNSSEAKWLLRRLSARLEMEMRKMSNPDPKKRRAPPPISMDELKHGKEDADAHGNSGESSGRTFDSTEARRRGRKRVDP
ncbi:potassium channel-like protein [Macroventuria anomochaeta]|uniref:Potassium channel-like protein n=1 Tax=Macroventuria anomochaeta TaxID=301207 RepID=A0ACB6SGY7_9PLEO|nr:potassium channel-like protein [Macroventuria anomochaeta]KAF2632529.1 potassium channel-like protein [Macroventuria anomochaeta]